MRSEGEIHSYHRRRRQLWPAQEEAIEILRRRRLEITYDEPRMMEVHKLIILGLNVSEIKKKVSYPSQVTEYMNALRKVNKVEQQGDLISLAKIGVRRGFVEPEVVLESFNPNLFDSLTPAQWRLLQDMGKNDLQDPHSYSIDAIGSRLGLEKATIVAQKMQIHQRLGGNIHFAVSRYVAAQMQLLADPDYEGFSPKTKEHLLQE